MRLVNDLTGNGLSSLQLVAYKIDVLLDRSDVSDDFDDFHLLLPYCKNKRCIIQLDV